MRQLGFEYVNGEYKPHANDNNFKFDAEAKVIKIVLITKKQFDSVIQSKRGKKKRIIIIKDFVHIKLSQNVLQRIIRIKAYLSNFWWMLKFRTIKFMWLYASLKLGKN